MTYEKSCGAVVCIKEKGERKYVLARSLTGSWGFPKGHMEPGETEEQTALREIYEEVHLKPVLCEGFRTTDEYPLPDKADTVKQVVFFCATCEDQGLRAQRSELREARLATYEEALRLLSFESSRRVLREAHAFLCG